MCVWLFYQLLGYLSPSGLPHPHLMWGYVPRFILSFYALFCGYPWETCFVFWREVWEKLGETAIKMYLKQEINNEKQSNLTKSKLRKVQLLNKQTNGDPNTLWFYRFTFIHIYLGLLSTLSMQVSLNYNLNFYLSFISSYLLCVYLEIILMTPKFAYSEKTIF